MLVSVLSFRAVTGADEPGQEDAAEIFKQRMNISLLLNKRFEYRVSTTKFPDSMVARECVRAVQDGIRILEIQAPKPNSTIAPYRLIHKKSNPGEPNLADAQIVTYWEVSNGSETRKFCRSLIFDQCRASFSHHGTIDAGPFPQFIGHDPFFIVAFRSTSFSQILAGGVVDRWEPDVSNIVVEKISRPSIGQVLRMRAPGQKGWSDYSIGPEHYLIDDDQSAIAAHRFEVHELKKFGGNTYPSKGRYIDPKTDSTFELLSVQELEPDWRIGDFPEWPRGTDVIDGINNNVFVVPFEAEEVSAIKAKMRSNCLALAVTPKATPWFLWVNSVLLGCLGTWFIVTRLLKKRVPNNHE